MKLGTLRQLMQSLDALEGDQLHSQMHERIRQLGLDPGNLYQELEMTSPYVDTHRDVSYSNARLSLHSHNFYELLYCRSSCGAEYLVGSERYRLQRGDIIFVPPGISHRPLLPETMEEPYRRYVLWLSQEFLESYARLLPKPFHQKTAPVGMLRTAGTKWETLGALFRSGVLEYEGQQEGWEAAVVGNTIQLLTQIKRATDERGARALEAEKPELLDRIMAHIEQNYATRLTLEELAREFFVSTSTVSHLFTQTLGVSFHRYVTQRRLIAAKSLIEQGTPLETTARATGFGDYSGFFRAFKQEYGINPRQYRALQAPGSKD